MGVKDEEWRGKGRERWSCKVECIRAGELTVIEPQLHVPVIPLVNSESGWDLGSADGLGPGIVDRFFTKCVLEVLKDWQ